MTTQTCGHLDAYDQGNGSVLLEWGVFPGTPPTSYNVYVNGVFNQNVVSRLATVTGLTQTSYSASAVAAPTGNSVRPQNMPPVGVVSPAPNYVFTVAAVIAGVEMAISKQRLVTPAPFSIMLKTPMKRAFPFPNTGSPDG